MPRCSRGGMSKSQLGGYETGEKERIMVLSGWGSRTLKRTEGLPEMYSNLFDQTPIDSRYNSSEALRIAAALPIRNDISCCWQLPKAPFWLARNAPSIERTNHVPERGPSPINTLLFFDTLSMLPCK